MNSANDLVTKDQTTEILESYINEFSIYQTYNFIIYDLLNNPYCYILTLQISVYCQILDMTYSWIISEQRKNYC